MGISADNLSNAGTKDNGAHKSEQLFIKALQDRHTFELRTINCFDRHFSLYFWKRLSLGTAFGDALLQNAKSLQQLRIDHFAIDARTFATSRQSLRLLTRLELSDSVL